MAKNNALINMQRELRKQAEAEIPAIYASIAMVLHEHGMDEDAIKKICYESQEKWAEHGTDLISMLIKCFNETGLQFMTPKQYQWAVSKGLVEGEISNE